mgnify:CR=1 FL=1
MAKHSTKMSEIMEEMARLGVVGGQLFDKNAVHQRRGLGKRRMLKGVTARASGMGDHSHRTAECFLVEAL